MELIPALVVSQFEKACHPEFIEGCEDVSLSLSKAILKPVSTSST